MIHITDKTIFIHYGSGRYDPSLFRPIMNDFLIHNKPETGTGLWASPYDSEYGWINLCNRTHQTPKEKSFKFTLNDISKVYIVRSLQSFLTLLNNYRCINPDKYTKGQSKEYRRASRDWCEDVKYINFELLSKNHDALFLSKEAIDEIDNLEYSLFWDCESIIIFNKQIIKPI